MLSLLARPQIQASVSWSPLDSRWYRDIGGTYSDTGTVVAPESALMISAVYRAVNVLADSVASIPLVVYRHTEGGKEVATEHPAYNLLQETPNAFQNSYEWRHQLMVQAILWGNHYSEIIPGAGGVGALVPLDPDTTRVVDQMRDGRLIYVTRAALGPGHGEERRLLQDDVFHVRGFSLDGKSGVPLTKIARNCFGLALDAERHGARFLKNGARFNGFLTSASPMKEDVRKQNEDAWQQQYGGSGSSGRTPVLTGGLEFKPASANNKDSQWLEARNFQIEEALRFVGVDPVMVGHPTQTQAFASVQELLQAYKTYGVGPWTDRIATGLNSRVIVGAPEYFAEFILEGLLKGNIEARYNAYRTGIAAGFLNRNEVRSKENMNPGPPELDVFLEPLNMAEAGAEREAPAPAPARPAPKPAEPDPNEEAARAQFVTIAARTAQRLARKETAAIVGTKGKLGAAAKHADNPDGWRAWLEAFYADHAVHVSEDMGVPLAIAERYCAAQRARFASLDGAEGAEAESIAALLRLTPAGRMAA